MSKTVWEKLNDEQMKELMDFNEEYRKFLSCSKTERSFVSNSVSLLKEAGFRELSETEGTLQAGDRIYVNNRGKNLFAFIIGKQDLTKGMNVLGAHIDSPRTDLKQKPVYESNGMVYLDTHYYGGIKKYQWVARPMALQGVVCKKDGTVIDINIGDHPGDPVFGFSDLLIHLSADQLQKPASKVIEGEQLDLLCGSIPLKGEEKDPVKANLLKILKEKYDIEEDDFISAEIEAVPAGEARDYGFDSSMILGYGHDDKVCGYTSLRALIDSDVPDKTACCILSDKEEVGSMGNTGMQSRIFENIILEILERNEKGTYRALNQVLSNSAMLSSDVSIAYDPNFPEVMEPRNSAYFGKGICFNKFTGRGGKGGSSDANAEYVARVRRVMEDSGITYQTCELGKVDAGGGGTIAYILANLNMDVIDAGICVQNMHAPFEVVSKADVYEAYRAYKAFVRDMD